MTLFASSAAGDPHLPPGDAWANRGGATACLADLNGLPAPTVLDQLPVSIAAVDTRGSIVFANSALAELLGYSRASIQEMSVRQVVVDLEHEERILPALKARTGNAVVLIDAHGAFIHTRLRTSPMRRRDDKLMFVTFTDCQP